MLLLAVTNQITMDLVVIPFLWVLPLCLYLLTFILCFERERWYSRSIYMSVLLPALIASLAILWAGKESDVIARRPITAFWLRFLNVSCALRVFLVTNTNQKTMLAFVSCDWRVARLPL